MALKLGITMLIHKKDDIEFVTEFPCLLAHPVLLQRTNKIYSRKEVMTFGKQTLLCLMTF